MMLQYLTKYIFVMLRRCRRIKRFGEKNPKEKILLGTGGTKKTSIQELTNSQDHETYVDKIVDTLEYDLILLKGLQTQEDKDK